MSWTRVTAAAFVGLAALGLTGCAGDHPDGPATAATVPTRHNAAPVAAGIAALDTAAAAEPGGRPVKLKVETRDGQRRFKVKVAAGRTEFTVLVDDSGQRVLAKARHGHASEDIAELDGGTVTAAQAVQTAANREPGTQLHEVEIDSGSAGAPVWEVELIRFDHAKVQYNIDAHTGKVVSP